MLAVAAALDKTDGSTNPVTVIVFIAGLAASMLGFGYAVKSLPIGTAYAVWAGIGASVTVIYAMATGSDPVSIVKIVLIAILVACVIGLKLAPNAH